MRPLALLGFMGAGKSTVGALVAVRVGAPFTDLDAAVAAALGAPIAEVFAGRGEKAFRKAEAEHLPGVLAGPGVVALGGGTPVDDASWALLRERATTVWLDAPLAVLLGRVGGDRERPLLAGRPETDLKALFEGRRRRYAEADHRVDCARPREEVVEEVVRLWSP